MGEIIQFPSQGELALGVSRKTQKQPMTVAPAVPTPTVQAPNPYARPTRSIHCHACGHRPKAHGSRYCSECTAAGRDSPIINCVIDGCTTVGKRQYTGQQFFVCPTHRPGKKNQ